LLFSRHSKNGIRWTLAAIAGLLLPGMLVVPAQTRETPEHRCGVIVVAFVGGIGTAHFPPSVAVPLLHHLESLHYPGVCVKEVSAYCPWCAHRWVRREFAMKIKGPPAELQLQGEPKVVLYGYSLGAPSALHLARQLEKDGIPIELTITVDSKGFTRGTVPRNVKVAANFYESGFLFPAAGKRNMRPEDPLATDFLGNIRVEHVGHLRIAGSTPVRELLINTSRALTNQSEDFAAELDDVLGVLDGDSEAGRVYGQFEIPDPTPPRIVPGDQ
jgi:hypothetical protein